jgi:hypothetical protein
MKRIEYASGDIVNTYGIAYVSELPFVIISNVKRRKAIFKCTCGKEFVSLIRDVTYNKRTSCGCKKGNKPEQFLEGSFINGVKFLKSLGTFKHAQRGIFQCPLCNKEWESSIANIKEDKTKSCCGVKRGWSKSQWMKLSKTAKLYKVRLYNNDESFIKIGITTKTIEARFRTVPYNFEVLKVIEGESGYIFDLELRCKKYFKKYSYKPLINFKGESECYIK